MLRRRARAAEVSGSASAVASGGAGRIAVVGSANLDVVVPVDRHPQPGETVLGGDHFRACGGKGANQAVAAARLGAQVAFVGQVGDDDPGQELLAALVDAGVDIAHVGGRPDPPGGLALSAGPPTGYNTLGVTPGANARLGATEIDAAGESLRSSDMVLVQLEVPLEAVRAAATAATGTVILNPAPATALLADLLDSVDILVPNRTELARLADQPVPATIAEVEQVLAALPQPERIVVTLGADGVLVRDGELHHLPPHAVEPVDATGAGDAFCGALAVALVEGSGLLDAARAANAAAAVAVTRPGAQPSLPSQAEVAALLEDAR
jgi:ribokinase